MSLGTKKLTRLAIFISITLLTAKVTSTTKTNLTLTQKINILLKNRKIRAFLDTIAFAEGTFHKFGYNTVFGAYLFKDLSDHPRVIISNKHKGGVLRSSAAGRYQFLEKTWDSLAKPLKLNSFSPINQDKAAIALIVKNRALPDILSNNLASAMKKLNYLWASLPGAPYNQRIIPIKILKDFYLQRLKYYSK